MTDTITTGKNDYGFNLAFTIYDSDGNARNITGYTVTLKVWKAGRPKELVINSACTVDVAASGTCHYTIAANDFREAARYNYELELTKEGVVDSSESGIIVVEDSP